MRMRLVLIGALVTAAPAWAGETPLYQPAPAWVAAAPPIDPAKINAESPVLLVYDRQHRVEGARVWNYSDTANRVATAQTLSEAGQITIPWIADQGDLIVHRVDIIRGVERIDLLAAGKRFTVLRREESLEQRQLTGVLTATMTVEGLRVGDVLRVSLSITETDKALGGRVQIMAPLLAAPTRIGFGRVRLSWPDRTPIRWRVHGAPPADPRLVGGMRELTVVLPLPKPVEMPGDAPQRFQKPVLLEAGGFAGWTEVSSAFAPLYATNGLIAPGTPLAAEVAAIAGAEADPLRRAQRALELVQDKVRYLLVTMSGGNYVPQTPADTWRLRYGDCKAKTLLLLAMLRELGVEAEGAVVAVGTGGLVPERLATPAAFNHIIVRATIGGETLWLDGTGSGARLADIRDTPPHRWALPLRAAGAELMPIAIRANARPDMEVALEFDESAGVDLPSVFRVSTTLRGPMAAGIGASAAQASAEQRLQMATRMITPWIGEAQVTAPDIRYDAASGLAVISVSGVTTTPWRTVDRRRRRTLDRIVDKSDFEPDRARADWRAIPVATEGPASVVFRTRVRLPDGGRGYTLEGDRTLPPTLAGSAVRRTVSLDGDLLTMEERVDSLGAEIAPADIPAERARVAMAKARLLKLVAPANFPKRWEMASARANPSRYKPIEDAFARAIAQDPKEVSGYRSRAAFRLGVYDRRGALEDLGRALAIEPSVDLHRERARIHEALGDTTAALADAEAARRLDPASSGAIVDVARLRAASGNAKGALALLDERIALGGEERSDYAGAKASVQADAGDTAGALATLDAAMADKPGSPSLLNERCWIKGTRKVALDTALKDCTKAIELGDSPAAPLDSRALVWMRMERWDDALADLDAALDAEPDQAGSLYLRGIVGKRLGRATAQADLAAARVLQPTIEKEYAKFGVAP